ncbi:MAG: glutathione binding-like protein [Paracoccaceae bacterium]
MRHLARREGRLGAGDARVDMWLEFGSTSLQPPFISVFWQRVRLLSKARDAKVEAVSLTAIGSALAIMEAVMVDNRPYMTGSEFSIADIALGCLFYRLLDLYPDTLAKTPLVAAWHGRIAARPAYQKWVATSYDELKVVS